MTRFPVDGERPLIFEGAFDPNLMFFRDFGREWEPFALTRPELVRRSHDAFLSAGADVLQTFSWGLYRGLDTEADRKSIMVNAARRAAEIAVEAAGRDRPRHRVAGIVYPGPSTVFGGCSHDELASAASLITGALIEGGVDLLVAALAAGMDDMRALLDGIAAANSTALPVLAAYEYQLPGLMSGEDLGDALSLAETLGAYSTGVYVTSDPVIVPEAGLRATHIFADAGVSNLDEENRCTVGSLKPAEYGETVAAQALRLGLRYVGGGWAVTPEHIRALRLRLT